MKTISHDRAKALTKTDLLVTFVLEGKRPALPSGVELAPSAARAAKAFGGEFRSTRRVDVASGPASGVLLVGVGKREDLDRDRLRRAAAVAVKASEQNGAAAATLWCDAALEKAVGGADVAGEVLVEGAVMGAYRFQRFKTKPKAPKLKRTALVGSGAAFRRGVSAGRAQADANCFARDLQNAPGNRMRPRDMATAARKLAQRSPRIRCKILDPRAMKELGMGALLGVAAGTSEPPRLIHLTYKPAKRSRGKVAVVGKGLTFDAGGISLKPAGRMWDMKYDMSGGAAVLGLFHALGDVDVPFEVHGIVPSSENMPDASAIKPGDLVTAMDGTSIEVLNTDAEGRLILCDALAYTVSKIQPDTIVDLATLTGAVVVALGHEMSGMFSDSADLREGLRAAGEEVGERVWHLPLYDFHRDQMKGEVGDLKNINNADQGGGSTSGAAFLSHFVGDVEWAHLDIAGTAWGGRDRDWVGGPKGSGVGTRLLLRYLQNR